MRPSVLLYACALFSAACSALAQPPPPAREFAVASIKPQSGPMRNIGVYTEGNTLNAYACNLRELLRFAFDAAYFRLGGSVPLMSGDDTRWDIVAKSDGPGAPDKASFREMLRSFLVSRFELQVHTEPRETPVYALMVAKGGPKLKLSAPDSERYVRIGPRNGSRNYWYSGAHSTIADLMSILNFDRPVIDKTDLTGVYDIEFVYTPEFLLVRSEDPGDISLFDALAPFGLKLESQKAMIEYILVDHAVKPSAN
jgi:uncharacterized protein (TIGR03435 family)